MSTSELAAAHATSRNLLGAAPLLIGANLLPESSAGIAEHINPTTGRPQSTFVVAGAPEVGEAVDAARAALPGWRSLPVDARRRALLAVASALRRAGARFDEIAAYEAGVPLKPGGVALKCADYFEFYAGWADKLNGAVVPVYPGRALDYTVLEPFGVIGALLSWNGPITAIGRKVAPALAAGNTVVVKSPELAPFSAHHFGRLCLEAGVPPGVVNVIAGGPAAGDALVRHPGVDKITFTGGVATASKVAAAAAAAMTPGVFELGGKSANIVFPDADLARAAAMAAQFGAVQASGQGCLLPTRLLVHEDAYDEILAHVLSRVGSVRVGDPLDGETEMGPVISREACHRILDLIEGARARGDGRLLVGGDRLQGSLSGGYFIPPTVFGEVSNSSDLAQNEVFGPVLSVLRFGSEEEAVRLANASAFGLAAYVHTRDLSTAHRVVAALDAGYVSVNGFNPMPPTAPFGGFKQSGYGYEGGWAGIAEFLRTKNVYIGLD